MYDWSFQNHGLGAQIENRKIEIFKKRTGIYVLNFTSLTTLKYARTKLNLCKHFNTVRLTWSSSIVPLTLLEA